MYVPIYLSQNNVLELWSLFDFLLPGFLGTERQFFERFGKPILLSRDAKSSSKEQEAGDTPINSTPLILSAAIQHRAVAHKVNYFLSFILFSA